MEVWRMDGKRYRKTNVWPFPPSGEENLCELIEKIRKKATITGRRWLVFTPAEEQLIKTLVEVGPIRSFAAFSVVGFLDAMIDPLRSHSSLVVTAMYMPEKCNSPLIGKCPQRLAIQMVIV